MSNSLSDIDKIELFEKAVRDEFSKDEKADFEQKIKSDRDLFMDYQAFLEGQNIIDSLAFKDKVKKAIDDTSNQKPQKQQWIWPISIAAALILSIFIFRPDSEENKEIFDQVFNRVPDLFSNRGIDTPMDDHIIKGLEAYNAGSSFASIGFFEESSALNDTIKLYQGINYLDLYKPREAINSFLKINSPELADQKNWYLGLAYLLNSDLDSVAFYLNKVEPKSDYQDKKKVIIEFID